jgi:hypothetical protein
LKKSLHCVTELRTLLSANVKAKEQAGKKRAAESDAAGGRKENESEGSVRRSEGKEKIKSRSVYVCSFPSYSTACAPSS